MRNAITVLLLSFILKFNANTGQLWTLFKNAATEVTSAEQLVAITKNFGENSPALLKGYRGIASLMMCNHVASPFTKLSYFKEGKKWIESAIQKDSSSLELRFFRFSTQCNAPAMLGYRSNLTSDKLFLIQYVLKNKDEKESVVKDVCDFLLSCGQLNEKEKKLIS